MEKQKQQQTVQGMVLGLAVGVSIGIALGEWYWSIIMGCAMMAAFSQVFVTDKDEDDKNTPT